jgi:hypothetical protein
MTLHIRNHAFDPAQLVNKESSIGIVKKEGKAG